MKQIHKHDHFWHYKVFFEKAFKFTNERVWGGGVALPFQ